MSVYALASIATDDAPRTVRVRVVSRVGQIRCVQLQEPLAAGDYIIVEEGDLEILPE